MNKFNEAKSKLVREAENKAVSYLLSKYGNGKLSKDTQAELSHEDGPIAGTFEFSGAIKCYAEVETSKGFHQVEVGMTINKGDLEVSADENIQESIESAINASEYLPTQETIKASLSEFTLTDRGDGYLLVSHAALNAANMGIVGKNEYDKSPNKAELLKTIVNDSVTRIASESTKLEFTGSFVEPIIEKKASDSPASEKITEEKVAIVEEKVTPKKSWLTADLEPVEKQAEDDEVGLIMAFEDGSLSDADTLKLFSMLVKNGHAWSLQGSYGRMAKSLIEQGWLDDKGTILKEISASSGTTCEYCGQALFDKHEESGFEGGADWATEDGDFGCDESPETNEEGVGSHQPAIKAEKKAFKKTAALDTDDKTISISENMPKARMSDSMSKFNQAEEQIVAAGNEKIRMQAANATITLLQGMGYGSARIAEVTPTAQGIDLMTYVEDGGTTKVVNIPVTLKDSTVILPKRSLVTTLISKGLDVRARLSEDFSREILAKIAEVDEKIAYEVNEVESILSEKPPVTKAAGDSRNTQFLGDTETLTVQKHLLPGWESLKEGDKVSDGTDQWEISNTSAQQNDKNKGSSSLWTLRKCAPPESDKKEPETTMPL